MTPNVLKARCHYCSKFRPQSELIQIGTGGVLMCLYCREWHEANMTASKLGTLPRGCGECRATWNELRLQISPGDNTSEVKMYLVPKDGIYQLLCRTCSDAYELKRADLLRGTLYGQTKGIV